LKQFRENESFSIFRVKYERLYRNSRIPNIPRDIPILLPVPITFIVDVSGSMDRYINAILNTIAHFEREMPVQKIFFSDTAIKSNDRRYYNAGGGTQIKPALELMKKSFITVVFSDYKFFDMQYKEFVNALMKKTKIAIMFDETLRVKEVIKK
jgi:DNA invertase Pin-like site-specific DNA recombinase